MATGKEDQDILLVKECAAGSEDAWNSFYCRFIGLVRSIIRRQRGISSYEMEDIAQNVFLALVPALKKYDSTYSLPRFVSIVAERVCIQEYRRVTAAKREASTDPVDHMDGSEEGARTLPSELQSQEEKLAEHQLVDILKIALRQLGSRCRELLRLRYYEEIPYKEITRILGATENTLTVQARRCLAELTAHYQELLRKGVVK